MTARTSRAKDELISSFSPHNNDRRTFLYNFEPEALVKAHGWIVWRRANGNCVVRICFDQLCEQGSADPVFSQIGFHREGQFRHRFLALLYFDGRTKPDRAKDFVS